MPAKKIVKKVSKKVVAKKTKVISKVSRSAEPHFLHKHISVTSPMGMILALAFLLAAAAVANAGYQAIKVSPASINKITSREIVVPRAESITGRVTRELRDERGQARYMLITSDGKKYELIGVNEGRKIEVMPNEREMNVKYRDGKTPRPSEKAMPEAEVMAENRRTMEKYVGKTVTVVGRSAGESNDAGSGRVAKPVMRFVVRSITLAQ